MKLFSPFNIALSLATVSLSNPVRRDVGRILADIADIASKASAFDNAVVTFPLVPGGSLLTALSVHNSAVALDNPLKTAASQVVSVGLIGDVDGLQILNAVSVILPTTDHALSEITAKKPAFVALPISALLSLIYQDLHSLKTSTDSFTTSLMDNVSPSLQIQATNFRAAALVGLDPVIAAYAP